MLDAGKICSAFNEGNRFVVKNIFQCLHSVTFGFKFSLSLCSYKNNLSHKKDSAIRKRNFLFLWIINLSVYFLLRKIGEIRKNLICLMQSVPHSEGGRFLEFLELVFYLYFRRKNFWRFKIHFGNKGIGFSNFLF